MLVDGICCCPDTCKEEISFLKSFAATRNQLINPSVNRPSRKSMNDDRMWLHVRTHTRAQGLVSHSVQYIVPGQYTFTILFSQFASCSGRWFVALRYGAALTACRRTGMIRHRCIKLFIFHTKINYRFYSHSIKKHGICV